MGAQGHVSPSANPCPCSSVISGYCCKTMRFCVGYPNLSVKYIAKQRGKYFNFVFQNGLVLQRQERTLKEQRCLPRWDVTLVRTGNIKSLSASIYFRIL